MWLLRRAGKDKAGWNGEPGYEFRGCLRGAGVEEGKAQPGSRLHTSRLRLLRVRMRRARGSLCPALPAGPHACAEAPLAQGPRRCSAGSSPVASPCRHTWFSHPRGKEPLPDTQESSLVTKEARGLCV